jgi:hypothetical protein
MLWAHAAGCPCDSWLHRIAGRLVRKSCTSSSKTSSSSSSSSSSNNSSSGSSSSSDYDVATRSHWNAVLFRHFFFGVAGVLEVFLLLLMVLLFFLVLY